jgi:hypothetical protein
MRLYPTLALVSSALALAACGGGGGGLSSGAGLTSGAVLDSAAEIRANELNVCGFGNGACDVRPTEVVTPSIPDKDGDGIPDDQDTDGSVGSGAGGNNTGIASTATGTRTLAIQSSKLDKPAAGTTALSVLTSAATPTRASTQAAILSANKPKSLKFAIDTKTAANSQWAVPVEQTEFVEGTRDLMWIEFNHLKQDLMLRDTRGNQIAFVPSNGTYIYLQSHTTTGGVSVLANQALTAADLSSAFYANQLSRVRDPNGNPLVFQPSRNAYIATVAHTVGGVTYNPGNVVDINEDFYWNQLVPYMSDKANGGAKTNYREYRAIDSSPEVNRDEVLQVWAWGDNSYSSHYVNRDGEDPKQHAWSFGGKEATNMPTSGSATYRGRFVGTAKTSNFIKQDGAVVDPNAAWRVQGRSELSANFGTNDIRGTLTPETWTSWQTEDKAYYTWFTQEAANVAPGDIPGVPSVATGSRPNYYQIYDAKVILEGKIKAPATTVAAAGTTAPPPVLNSFEGTASLNKPYLSSNNPMYGGFFGANGTDATGIFNVAGALVQPIGGSAGLIGDRGAYLDMNGSFNAKCTIVVATGLCAP